MFKLYSSLLVVIIQYLLPTIGSATAEFLSPQMHYRKIKMRLVGAEPTNSEYEAFQRSIESCQSSVESEQKSCIDKQLSLIIHDLMGRQEYIGKIQDFARELFYLKPLGKHYEKISDSESLYYGNEDTFSNLVARIFSNNLSWDEFYTSGEFSFNSNQANGFGGVDYKYFSAYLSDEDKKNLILYNPNNYNYGESNDFYTNNQKEITVKVEDPNLAAGFMITPRFNARYYNTNINEGRKRSAAILRIGLCDPMFPAIERGQEHVGLEDEIAKGLNFDEILKAQNTAKLHGKRRDCMQCHVYRGLDHLAWTFRASEFVLDRKPSPGRFTYIREDGSLINDEVKGIGDFARKLVAEKQYRDCQTSHFFEKFVGDLKYLKQDPELLEKIGDNFDKVGRRVNDFIEYLLLSDEFRFKKRPHFVINELYKRAEAVLVNCNNCHKGKRPNFTKLPMIRKGKDVTEKYAELILEDLGIKPVSFDGIRSMPPDSSPWQPNPDQIKDIENWIRSGMPDANGKKHLSESWLSSVFGEKQ